MASFTFSDNNDPFSDTGQTIHRGKRPRRMRVKKYNVDISSTMVADADAEEEGKTVLKTSDSDTNVNDKTAQLNIGKDLEKEQPENDDKKDQFDVTTKITSLKAWATAPFNASAVPTPIPHTMNPSWLISEYAEFLQDCGRELEHDDGQSELK